MHVKVWELMGRKFNVAKHVFYGTGNVDMYVMTDLKIQTSNEHVIKKLQKRKALTTL